MNIKIGMAVWVMRWALRRLGTIQLLCRDMMDHERRKDVILALFRVHEEIGNLERVLREPLAPAAAVPAEKVETGEVSRGGAEAQRV